MVLHNDRNCAKQIILVNSIAQCGQGAVPCLLLSGQGTVPWFVDLFCQRRLDRFFQRLHALAGNGGGLDDRFGGGQVRVGGEGLPAGGALGLVQLVALGQHAQEGIAAVRQKPQHGAVVGGGVVAHVQQLHDQADLPPHGKVPLHQLAPAAAFRVGALRVAVARQVGDAHAVAPEEVDRGGLARHAADAGQIFAVEEFVDEGRLAHVGLAREDDLREIGRGKLLRRAVGRLKLYVVDVHGGFLVCFGQSGNGSLIDACFFMRLSVNQRTVS